MVSCSNDDDNVIDFEQQVKSNADFQYGARLARAKYHKIDSIVGAHMKSAPNGLIDKFYMLSENELNDMCHGVSFEEISNFAVSCEDAAIDKLIECTSEEDARDILSMKDDFFYYGNPDRYEMLVSVTNNRSQNAKKYMYMMAGALIGMEELLVPNNMSRAYGDCDDMLRFELAKTFTTALLERELDIDLATTEDELVGMLIDFGYDAIEAAELAHKYYQCKMGIIIP